MKWSPIEAVAWCLATVAVVALIGCAAWVRTVDRWVSDSARGIEVERAALLEERRVLEAEAARIIQQAAEVRDCVEAAEARHVAHAIADARATRRTP